MRTYEEISARIMQKGDEMIETRRIRNTKIRQTTFALSGMCAAVITGAGIWHLNVKDKVTRTENRSSAIEEPVNTTASETAVNTTQTTAKTTSSNNKTTTVTSETVTEVSEVGKTTVASSVQTTCKNTSAVSAIIASKTTAATQTETVTETGTHQESQQSATEPTQLDVPAVTETAQVTTARPVTIPCSATVEETTQTEIVVPVSPTGTSTIPCGAEVTVDPEQRRFISYSEIEASHQILELNSASYRLSGMYGSVSDIPEGTASSGINTVFGVDSVTGKSYYISFEAFFLSDGNILVRFGEGEDIYLYFGK